MAAAMRARLICTGQSLRQVSTNKDHAKGSGQVCGSHHCLNGIGISAIRAITCSRVRIRGVAVGGSRLSTGLFIHASMHQGDVRAAGRLSAPDDQSLLWRIEFYALNSFYVQSGIQAAEGNVPA